VAHQLAGKPTREGEIPAAVARLAAGRRLRAVWANQLGGLTFEVGTGAQRSFVKWAAVGSGLDFAAEAERIGWATEFAAVPRLLDRGSDPTGSWLVTSPLGGDSAVAARWLKDPATAVSQIGAGLRVLHDSLPVERCPFSWSLTDRLATVGRRRDSGQLDPGAWHEVHRDLSVDEALARLAAAPAIDRLVVCHGDACAPNTILSRDGRLSGHVDLGALGVGDRWGDLAIATWSTEWNYGPGWEDTLLRAYGAEPDPLRTAYYRLLWDVEY
jgi:kanamycin kinase